MPIRLNLLAEAQAIEDVRRRDPIKRVLFIGAVLLVLLLAWASFVQYQSMQATKRLNLVEGDIRAKANDYKQVVENRKRLTDTNGKLAALNALSTNRFLNGNLLHALQQITVDDVQLIHLRVDQNYIPADEVKARTNGTRFIPGTPPTVTEKIALILDGADNSSSPGDQVTKFKEALAANPYIRAQINGANQVNLKNLSAPQISPDTGRAMVLFTLEWRYPDNTR